jgi:5-methylcytosine-specific restriction endonuclease McrA
LPFINSPKILKDEFKKLKNQRKKQKLKIKRDYRLSISERKIIYLKTDGLCHICGKNLDIKKFEANHVKPYSESANNKHENYLPSCKTCNNYRWNYLPDEIQWILKLGVWTKSQIEKDNDLGKKISISFLENENQREVRRKNPRKPKVND